MDSIDQNLQNFYKTLGKKSNIKKIKEQGFNVLTENNGYWPQFIFNIDYTIKPEKLIPYLGSLIREKKYPRFLVLPDTYISRDQLQLLQANKILPIKILRGMSLIEEQFNSSKTEHLSKIIELKTKEQIKEFSELVNKELMASDLGLNPHSIISENLDNQLKIFGFKENAQLVSCSLVFIHKKTAGLYFIATKKEYQKKGYASNLLKHVISKLFSFGIKEVVLHANNNASKFYEKIGFSHHNNFIVFNIE